MDGGRLVIMLYFPIGALIVIHQKKFLPEKLYSVPSIWVKQTKC
jgi:hypothetical protein